MIFCTLSVLAHFPFKATKSNFIIRWKNLCTKGTRRSSWCEKKKQKKRLRTASLHPTSTPENMERHSSAGTLNSLSRISVASSTMFAKRITRCLRKGSRLRLHKYRTVHLSVLALVRYSCRGNKGLSHARPKSRCKKEHIRWRKVASKMQLEGFITRRTQLMEHLEWALIHSKRVRSLHKTMWSKSLKTKRQSICQQEIDL